MKNSEDHIDKLFRDNLENQSFDIPTEFIDDLTNRLDDITPNKKRKKDVWFFIFNSLFLVVFTMLSFINQSPILNAENHSIHNHTDEIKITSESSTNSKLVKGKLETKSNNKLELVENSELNTEDKEGVKITASSLGDSFTKTKDNPTSSNGYSSTGGQNPPTGNQAPNSYNSNGGTTFSEPDNNSTFPPDTVIIRDTIIVLDTLIIRDTVIVTDTIRVPDTSKVNEDDSKWKMEIQLFSGLNYGANSFTSSTSSGPSYLLEESAIFSPSFGFNINASWNSINVGSGIDYFQTGEKFSVNSSSVTQYDTVEVVGYDFDTVVFNQQTQTWDSIYVPVYDSVTYYDTTTFTDNWVNTYSWLSVPLHIGYRFDFGKWAVIPRAGVTFNIGMRNSQGRYPSIVGNDIYIAPSSPVVFNLDYLLQVELRRSLRKAEIYVSPSYRGNLTPMNTDRKYQSLGLRLGVVIPL